MLSELHIAQGHGSVLRVLARWTKTDVIRRNTFGMQICAPQGAHLLLFLLTGATGAPGEPLWRSQNPPFGLWQPLCRLHGGEGVCDETISDQCNGNLYRGVLGPAVG
jgi:hypothetical protein